MTAETGRVTGNEVKKHRDGEQAVRLLQCVITEEDDNQTIQLLGASGEDSPPLDNATVLIISVGSTKFAIAVDDGIIPDAEKGEKKLYSVKDGQKQAVITLRTNKNIELNGDDDFAVRFSKLEEAFNEQKTVYNSHIHLENPQSPTLTLPPLQQSAADISLAKIKSIKVPADG